MVRMCFNAFALRCFFGLWMVLPSNWPLPTVPDAWAAELPSPTHAGTYRPIEAAKARLGQNLFYDRVLSGTYRVSCATCHNHDRGSSNGFRLDGAAEPSFDELATNGVSPWAPFQPSSRHAPTLFNLGAYEFDTLFSDGRLEKVDGRLVTPLDAKLPKGVDDVLAAQALFPTITPDELTGTTGSDLPQDDGDASIHEGIWRSLVLRVADLPDYLPLFREAYSEINDADDIRIDHIANGLAAFVGGEWRSDNAPFDRYLKGDRKALTADQLKGMKLFYGEAQCSACHAGIFQTDHDFHSVGLTDVSHKREAEQQGIPRWRGRYNVTASAEDFLAVRTPSLRNVLRTAPYGLAGQYDSLATAILAHTAPVGKSIETRQSGASKPTAWRALGARVQINEADLSALVAFLESLTDEKGLMGRLGKPESVPSSLSLD